MKRKVKRRYTRSASSGQARRIVETATESATEPIKAGSRGIIPLLYHKVNVVEPSVVTQADIDLLPPSLVYELQAGTKWRALANRILPGKFPDNLRERTEAVVRRFRGY